MLNQAVLFLLETLTSLLAGAFLLRFYMQLRRAPFRNPLGNFLLAATDFAVKPLRRVIPGLLGWDWASLVAAWLTELALVSGIIALSGHELALPAALAGVSFMAAVKLLALAVHMLIWIVVITAIFSWVQPHHWINAFAGGLVQPLLRPLQKVLPLVGNVDLSPLALILILQLILMAPIAWLEQFAVRLV
ncbi:MAG: YggT family protein [Sulfuricellaceae bacterium]|nr:YggT family protein [Sulfuricellaceae bacterium]